MKKLILTLALVAMGSVAYAQVYSDNITADANVVTALTVDGFRNLDFGSVVQGETYTIAFTSTSSGRFDITGGTAATDVDVSFSALPATLTGPGDPIGITYTAGYNSTTTESSATTFTPASGVTTALNGSGALYVFLGGEITPAANQTAGAYTATVTLQVSYN